VQRWLTFGSTMFISMVFKNSVPTSKKTQHVSSENANWLMLFKEIAAVYSENHKKP
jgi:hypothetical protein